MAKSKATIKYEFLKGLWDENPVLKSLLGLCPVLAVTNSAINGLAMGLATTFVLLSSSIIISSIRNIIPNQVRIPAFIVIMAGIREELELAKVPKPFEGAGITMIVAASLALAFMGFAGLISV